MILYPRHYTEEYYGKKILSKKKMIPTSTKAYNRENSVNLDYAARNYHSNIGTSVNIQLIMTTRILTEPLNEISCL